MNSWARGKSVQGAAEARGRRASSSWIPRMLEFITRARARSITDHPQWGPYHTWTWYTTVLERSIKAKQYLNYFSIENTLRMFSYQRQVVKR